MSDSTESANDIPDVRVYLRDPAMWSAVVKPTTEKMYCYQRNPGEEYFHLILMGEIYLENGDEKLCLRAPCDGMPSRRIGSPGSIASIGGLRPWCKRA